MPVLCETWRYLPRELREKLLAASAAMAAQERLKRGDIAGAEAVIRAAAGAGIEVPEELRKATRAARLLADAAAKLGLAAEKALDQPDGAIQYAGEAEKLAREAGETYPAAAPLAEEVAHRAEAVKRLAASVVEARQAEELLREAAGEARRAADTLAEATSHADMEEAARHFGNAARLLAAAEEHIGRLEPPQGLPGEAAEPLREAAGRLRAAAGSLKEYLEGLYRLVYETHPAYTRLFYDSVSGTPLGRELEKPPSGFAEKLLASYTELESILSTLAERAEEYAASHPLSIPTMGELSVLFRTALGVLSLPETLFHLLRQHALAAALALQGHGREAAEALRRVVEEMIPRSPSDIAAMALVALALSPLMEAGGALSKAARAVFAAAAPELEALGAAVSRAAAAAAEALRGARMRALRLGEAETLAEGEGFYLPGSRVEPRPELLAARAKELLRQAEAILERAAETGEAQPGELARLLQEARYAELAARVAENLEEAKRLARELRVEPAKVLSRETVPRVLEALEEAREAAEKLREAGLPVGDLVERIEEAIETGRGLADYAAHIARTGEWDEIVVSALTRELERLLEKSPAEALRLVDRAIRELAGSPGRVERILEEALAEALSDEEIAAKLLAARDLETVSRELEELARRARYEETRAKAQELLARLREEAARARGFRLTEAVTNRIVQLMNRVADLLQDAGMEDLAGEARRVAEEAAKARDPAELLRQLRSLLDRMRHVDVLEAFDLAEPIDALYRAIRKSVEEGRGVEHWYRIDLYEKRVENLTPAQIRALAELLRGRGEYRVGRVRVVKDADVRPGETEYRIRLEDTETGHWMELYVRARLDPETGKIRVDTAAAVDPELVAEPRLLGELAEDALAELERIKDRLLVIDPRADLAPVIEALESLRRLRTVPLKRPGGMQPTGPPPGLPGWFRGFHIDWYRLDGVTLGVVDSAEFDDLVRSLKEHGIGYETVDIGGIPGIRPAGYNVAITVDTLIEAEKTSQGGGGSQKEKQGEEEKQLEINTKMAALPAGPGSPPAPALSPPPLPSLPLVFGAAAARAGRRERERYRII